MAALVKTAETMGILDTYSDGAKQADIDEILGFLASLEKVGWLKLLYKTRNWKYKFLLYFLFNACEFSRNIFLEGATIWERPEKKPHE